MSIRRGQFLQIAAGAALAPGMSGGARAVMIRDANIKLG